MENQVQIPEIPAERILIERNHQAIERFNRETGELKTAVAKALVAFKAVGVGELSLGELESLARGYTNTEKLVRERVAGDDHVTVGNLKISAAKLRDIVEIPNTKAFDKALAELQQVMKPNINYNKHKTSVSIFELVDGEVVLQDVVLERFTDSQSVYAESEAEKECYVILQQIQGLLNHVVDKYSFPILQRGTILTQASLSGSRKAVINFHALKSELRGIIPSKRG